MDAQAMTALFGELGAQISGAQHPLAGLEERERERLARLSTLEEKEPGIPPQVKSDLRCLTFDGATKVEVFIDQFVGVTRLAQWPAEVRLLQVRATLLDGAQTLGHAPTEQRIMAALWLRYRLTFLEASVGYFDFPIWLY